MQKLKIENRKLKREVEIEKLKQSIVLRKKKEEHKQRYLSLFSIASNAVESLQKVLSENPTEDSKIEFKQLVLSYNELLEDKMKFIMEESEDSSTIDSVNDKRTLLQLCENEEWKYIGKYASQHSFGKWILNEENEKHENPFFICCRKGVLSVIKAFHTVSNSFEVFVPNRMSYDKFKEIAIQESCENGNLEVVDWLMRNYNFGECFFNYASKVGDLGLVKLSFLYYENLIKELQNPLLPAATYGNFHIVKWLYSKRKLTQDELKDCIIVSVKNNYTEIVKWIVARGCSPKNLVDTDDCLNRTCLLISVSKGNLELVKFFINNGCSIDERDDDGNTSLHIAASKGNLEIIQWLLENTNSDNPLLKSSVNGTCIMIAAKQKQVDMVVWMLQHGASIHENSLLREDKIVKSNESCKDILIHEKIYDDVAKLVDMDKEEQKFNAAVIKDISSSKKKNRRRKKKKKKYSEFDIIPPYANTTYSQKELNFVLSKFPINLAGPFHVFCGKKFEISKKLDKEVIFMIIMCACINGKLSYVYDCIEKGIEIDECTLNMMIQIAINHWNIDLYKCCLDLQASESYIHVEFSSFFTETLEEGIAKPIPQAITTPELFLEILHNYSTLYGMEIRELEQSEDENADNYFLAFDVIWKKLLQTYVDDDHYSEHIYLFFEMTCNYLKENLPDDFSLDMKWYISFSELLETNSLFLLKIVYRILFENNPNLSTHVYMNSLFYIKKCPFTILEYILEKEEEITRCRIFSLMLYLGYTEKIPVDYIIESKIGFKILDWISKRILYEEVDWVKVYNAFEFLENIGSFNDVDIFEDENIVYFGNDDKWLPILQKIISYGANPNIKFKESENILALSIACNAFEIFFWLLSNCNVNSCLSHDIGDKNILYVTMTNEKISEGFKQKIYFAIIAYSVKHNFNAMAELMGTMPQNLKQDLLQQSKYKLLFYNLITIEQSRVGKTN